RSLCGLAGLLADVFALVAHALSLVRLGPADLADVRRDLTDHLFVVPADGDAVGRGDLELDPLGRLHGHGVREAERELDVRALQSGPVSHADDLQALLVALRHALDHVRHERAREAVQRAMEAVVVRPLHTDRAVLANDPDLRMERILERAARTLHGHVRSVDRDVDATRDIDRLLPNPAHLFLSSLRSSSPVTTHMPAPRRRGAASRLPCRSSVLATWTGSRCPTLPGRAGARRASRRRVGPASRRAGAR